MTDLGELLKHLHSRFTSCSSCVSPIGARFALVQLLFEVEAVLSIIRAATEELRENLYEYDIDQLKDVNIWDWNYSVCCIGHYDAESDINAVISKTIDFFPSNVMRSDILGGKDEKYMSDLNASVADGESKIKADFREIVVKGSSMGSDSIDMLVNALRISVGKLKIAIGLFIKVDSETERPDSAYERFYESLELKMDIKSEIGKKLKLWMSECPEPTKDDFKFKLLEDIKLFNEKKCLTSVSNLRSKEEDDAREYLQSLGTNEPIDNMHVKAYALLSRFINKRSFSFTINHSKIGKYIFSHRQRIDPEKRLQIRIFEESVRMLTEKYESLYPSKPGELSIPDKIKKDLSPINKDIRKDWRDWKFNLFWDRLYEDTDMRVALEVVSPITFDGRYNMKLVIGILSWMASVQKDRIIETTKTKLDNELYGTGTHKTYFSLTQNSIDDYKATIKRILADIDKIKDKK